MTTDERRYHGFDALRGGMMLLGLALHAATFYLAAPPPTMPMIFDRSTWFGMDILFQFIHSFRMPVFFIMAGFFASLLVEKRGMFGMFRNRAARILAPLLAGLVLVLPPTILFMVSFLVSVRFGTHDLVPRYEDAYAVGRAAIEKHPEVNQPSPLHLWFLYYLCYFYLIVPLLRPLSARLKAHAARQGDRLGRVIGSAPAFALLALFSAATLWPFQGGQLHEGFLFFAPHPPSLLYYGAFFVMGYLLHGAGLISHLRLAPLGRYLLLGLIIFPVAMYASRMDYQFGSALWSAHFFACLAQAVCTWAWIHVFVGVALRWVDHASPWFHYVS